VFGRDLRASVPTLKRVRPWEGERDYVYAGIGLRRDNDASDLGLLGRNPAAGPGSPRTEPLYSPKAFDPAGAFGHRRGDA
jgi:hypothetical protein